MLGLTEKAELGTQIRNAAGHDGVGRSVGTPLRPDPAPGRRAEPVSAGDGMLGGVAGGHSSLENPMPVRSRPPPGQDNRGLHCSHRSKGPRT